jgi:hypothetical protein
VRRSELEAPSSAETVIEEGGPAVKAFDARFMLMSMSKAFTPAS